MRPHRRSLRVQLLVTVNAVAFVGIGSWLAVDYRRELSDQLGNARASLANEARALAPLLFHLHRTQPTEVQALIDEVCVSMRTEDSPEHHIVVSFGDQVYESAAHPGTNRGSAVGLNSAGETGRLNADEDSLVSGQYQTEGVSVHVSKSPAVVMREVRRRALARLAAMCLGAVTVALIANLLIIRLVNRPLTRLVAVVRKIAGGELGLTPGRFHTAEFNFLAEEIGQMSVALAEIEKDRRSQIAKARQLQQHLCPSRERLAGLELVAAYMPADNIAGDYYDALPLEGFPDRPAFMLCLADVCGHGVPAAMGASMLKALLLDACEKTADPSAVLGHINRQFVEVSLPGDFASMFVAMVRPGHAELAYSSAGHEYGYLVGVGGCVSPLASTGTLIGIDPHLKWHTREVPVCPGDRLLLVSDGVTEAFDAQGKQFGRERLALLLQNAPAGADGLLRAVLSTLSAHTCNTPLRDDVTVVVTGLDRVNATIAGTAKDKREAVM